MDINKRKKKPELKIKKKKKENPNKKQDLPGVLPRNMILQRTIGNQEVQRLFKTTQILAKLFVNQPGDVYEQEADRIAQKIISIGDKEVRLKTSETKVQKKDFFGGSSISSHTETGINSIKGKGRPFEPKIRDYFQPRFGVDLGDVRIHTDSNADRLARAIRARAFTLGNDVVFAKDQYKPETQEGKKLVAHELTHVLQQGGGKKRVIQRAEWFINSDKVGVRKTGLVDIPCDLPLIGSGIRGILRLLGNEDIDTDYLPVISEWDEVAREIEQLKQSDYFDAALLVISVILSSYQAIKSGKKGFDYVTQFLKAMFVPGNPFSKNDILIFINTLLTDYGYVGLAIDSIEGLLDPVVIGVLENIYSDTGRAMKNAFRQILGATKLSDFKWYNSSYTDLLIFMMANDANIPLEVQNIWSGDRCTEKAVARQMMRNYMFIGDMAFKYEMRSAKELKMLFWGWVGREEDIGHGIKIYKWNLGFAERNVGPYNFFEEMKNDEYVKGILEMKRIVDEMNMYRYMEFLFYNNKEKFFEYSFDFQDKYFFDFRKYKLADYNLLIYAYQRDFQETIYFYNKDEAYIREFINKLR